MDITVALTGQLPAILMAAAVLTAPLSWLLLRAYRRAVIRSMARSASAAAATGGPPIETALTGSDTPPLAIVRIDGAQDPAAGHRVNPWLQTLRREWRRSTIVYVLAGLAFAMVIAFPRTIQPDRHFYPGRYTWITVCYLWPLVVALWLMTPERRWRLQIAAVYVATLGVVGTWVLLKNPEASAYQLPLYWVLTNGWESLVPLAFLIRPLRAIGPLVLIFVVAGVTGAAVLVTVAGLSEEFLRAYVTAGNALGLGATPLFFLLHLVGFALGAGLLGQFLVRWLSRRYRAKKTSDQVLILDSLFLLFGIMHSVDLAFEHWSWALTGVVAFLAYKLVTIAGFGARARLRPDSNPPPTLLLLRVFSLGKRSARLYDSIAGRWRHIGSVSMISGPDLATSTLEPHELIEFLGRRLARQFVGGDEDLEKRIAALDEGPDPDGRFRVNEFFCFSDTWQPTMQRLARSASAVLMDLRSFASANRGCLFEIGQLLATVPLERVVFVVDATTDQSFLATCLQQEWRAVPESSPNRRAAPPPLRSFEMRPPETRSVVSLLRAMTAATGNT